MNPVELRYEIYKPLVGVARPAQIESAELVSPVPGEPVKIRVITRDPMRQPRTLVVSVHEE
ncbi:hypothetical protein [Streptomyces asiaticus]|uniref:hypothetical protein n=1 Tax=Streptomyces asiaticus TaxID=114695 RepID=UPI003F67F75C